MESRLCWRQTRRALCIRRPEKTSSDIGEEDLGNGLVSPLTRRYWWNVK